MTPSPDVTSLLVNWGKGQPSALDRLVPLVYDELRELARRYMSREPASHTLQPTALVHEAYLRLVDQQRVDWRNRAHFVGIAARMMRRVLVDHARAQAAGKRGGQAVTVSLDDEVAGAAGRPVDLLSIERALDALESLDPRQARIVELRAFGGLTIEEAAEVVKVSPATVKREWRSARAWIAREISKRGVEEARDARG